MTDPKPYKKIEALKLLYGDETIDDYIQWMVEKAIPKEISFLAIDKGNFRTEDSYNIFYDSTARFIINRQLLELWEKTQLAAKTLNVAVQDLIGKVKPEYSHVNLEAVIHERYFPHNKQEVEDGQTEEK